MYRKAPDMTMILIKTICFGAVFALVCVSLMSLFEDKNLRLTVLAIMVFFLSTTGKMHKYVKKEESQEKLEMIEKMESEGRPSKEIDQMLRSYKNKFRRRISFIPKRLIINFTILNCIFLVFIVWGIVQKIK